MSETRQLTFTDKIKLEAELAELIEAKKKVAEDIQTARGFGDLSENAEYDAAKAKEAEVYGNIHRIEQILRTANFVDDKAVSTDVVSLGNVVKVKDLEYDEIDEYTLVGFTEADPMKLFVSNESPIGEALMGASVGEIVEANTPGGKVRLEILDIRKR
jgi:transcription elongation factor GreA